jgi:hypothetical protein
MPSQPHTTQDAEGLMAGAEQAPENNKLSHNVLGLIGAYRMDGALNAQDLLPTGRGSGASAQASVVAPRPSAFSW